MKTITRNEWDKVSHDLKRVFETTPYMFYKESDGSIYFGPVRIIEGDALKISKDVNKQKKDF